MISFPSLFRKINDTEKLKNRSVVIDVETTGLELNKNNVIELAGVELVNGNMTGNSFHAYLRPRHKIQETAKKLNKIDDDFYDKFCNSFYNEEKIILQNFMSFCADSCIIAHFADFDYKFLKQELEFFGLDKIERNQFCCSLDLFRFFLDETI